MQYYSTNNRSLIADFRQATLEGQPADKGLYFPSVIPKLPDNFINDLRNFSKEDIAFTIIKPFIGNTIEDEALRKIVSETIDFSFPLQKITDSIYSLELFHGPTLAFKDVGARFMSRCLGYFSQGEKKKTTVLVATSGDTGGAVAHAFQGVENVDVVILFPSGKVSEIQERQLTTLGKNITALEIDGSFDDCQRMVKDAFVDDDLNKHLRLTSANSINVARWLPQQFYYFFAHQQWTDSEPPVIAVPSGNFGNICAGLLAHLSGLPAKHFIAACNINDIATHYLETGELSTKKSRPTLSNAMDVGNPSNFIRILELFQHNHPAIKTLLSSYAISDEETVSTIKEVMAENDYLLDPHGAVGYAALKRYLASQPSLSGYFLETAHPVKFAVEEIIEKKIELPASVKSLLQKEKKSVKMSAATNQLKEFLLAE